ncbi:MAG: recombinase family protein [Candidatus Sulfotelmatobacter sp.]|jgi:DNA invertase Pin-like site-specific DNA recombinase
MKKAAIYGRVSTNDQNVESQFCDLRSLAKARGYEIVAEYSDTISGTKAKRPGLDHLLSDARRGRFNVVFVWAFDRIARSVKHFLEVMDELNRLNVGFVSFRENIDTDSALGRALIIIVAAIGELEKSLIVERVKSGMRRAKLEGRQIGRARLDINREQVIQDRRSGMSLTAVAKRHSISRASVCSLMKESNTNSHAVAVLTSDGNVAAQVRL